MLFSCLSSQAQTPKDTLVHNLKVDTIIHELNYSSYFSFTTKTPLFVVYKLYKGGGDCSRTTFHFTTNIPPTKCLHANDYSHSGYDEGHLANSEDFAGNCILDKNTFKFENALPQTANLNRGCWKKNETEIRNISQNDSLLIICGGLFESTNKTIGSGLAPTQCWKIVYNLRTKQYIIVNIFNNDMENSVMTAIKINELVGLINKNYKGFDLLHILRNKK